MENSIFIAGNTASSKNSKINTSKGSFMSKTCKKYLRSLGIQTFSSSKRTVTLYKTIPLNFPLDELKELFKDVEYPVFIGMHFIRGTRHHADFQNITQLILDLFQAFEIIPDDDMDHIFAVPFKINNKYYSYDKENPGVYIKIINNLWLN